MVKAKATGAHPAQNEKATYEKYRTEFLVKDIHKYATAPQTLFISTPSNGNNEPAGIPDLDLLDFTVATRDMFVANPSMPNMASLVPPQIARALVKTNTGSVLGTVKDQHKNVQNSTLHECFATTLSSSLPQSYIRNIKLSETQSGGFSFNKAMYQICDHHGTIFQLNGTKTRVDLQLAWINAHGSRAVQIMQTGLDHSCQNQLIYTAEKLAVQHMQSFDIATIAAFIRKATHDFPSHVQTLQSFAFKQITIADLKRILKANDQIGSTSSEAIMSQYETEVKNRGSSLFAALSALAAWSTHNDGDFHVRNSGNTDNEARSLFARQEKVMKLIGSNAFQEVAA